MPDLESLRQALHNNPQIQGIHRRPPDDFIDHERWSITLAGSWKAGQMGTGPTIEEAFADALAIRAMEEDG